MCFISRKERGRTKQSVCLGPEQPPAHSRGQQSLTNGPKQRLSHWSAHTVFVTESHTQTHNISLTPDILTLYTAGSKSLFYQKIKDKLCLWLSMQCDVKTQQTQLFSLVLIWWRVCNTTCLWSRIVSFNIHVKTWCVCMLKESVFIFRTLTDLALILLVAPTASVTGSMASSTCKKKKLYIYIKCTLVILSSTK